MSNAVNFILGGALLGGSYNKWSYTKLYIDKAEKALKVEESYKKNSINLINNFKKENKKLAKKNRELEAKKEKNSDCDEIKKISKHDDDVAVQTCLFCEENKNKLSEANLNLDYFKEAFNTMRPDNYKNSLDASESYHAWIQRQYTIERGLIEKSEKSETKLTELAKERDSLQDQLKSMHEITQRNNILEEENKSIMQKFESIKKYEDTISNLEKGIEFMKHDINVLFQAITALTNNEQIKKIELAYVSSDKQEKKILLEKFVKEKPLIKSVYAQTWNPLHHVNNNPLVYLVEE